MKKTILIFALVLAVIFSIGPGQVLANDIENINLDVTIHQDASMTIRDHRIFNADSGTEHFISLGNLGPSELLSYKVYDENGTELEYVQNWDIDASREEKAGKYGINHTSDGMELCFGIGQLGRREFTIEYTLSNGVFNLQDGNQALYWRFLNDGMDSVDQANIRIKNDTGYKFEYPQTRFWAFGLHADTSIEEDVLSITTNRPLSSNNYAVALVVFEGKAFDATNTQDWTSESIIDQAFEGISQEEIDAGNEGQSGSTYVPSRGSSSSSSSNSGLFDGLGDFIGKFLFGGAAFMWIAMIFTGFFNAFFPATKKERFKPSPNIDYYSQVPHENFILTNALMGQEMSDIVAAYIMKWIFEGRLMERVGETGFLFKRDSLELLVQEGFEIPSDPREANLWAMIRTAAGSDKVLTENEFNRYVRANFKSITSWLTRIENDSKKYLAENGYYQTVDTKTLWKDRKISKLTSKGQELGDHIHGFKKYLKDYSLVGQREVSHARLWNEYMIWAAYLGIAEEVYDQLKIVNPNMIEYDGDFRRTVVLTNTFSNSAQSSYVSRTSSSGTSSSGGGGSSFGGGGSGGGGSFGGGSGGGTR